jgi:hypothetical protein
VNYRTRFYDLAQKAIRAGLLTEKERDIISRRGTRKEWAWGRHYRDLKEVLAERTGPVRGEKMNLKEKYIIYLLWIAVNGVKRVLWLANGTQADIDKACDYGFYHYQYFRVYAFPVGTRDAYGKSMELFKRELSGLMSKEKAIQEVID